MPTKFLYLPEVAERLGRDLSTVRWLVHTKALPSGKLAGRRVIRESDLEAYIESAFEASA